MKPVVRLALIAALATAGCKRDRTPQRTATKIPQRTASRSFGPPLAGDPTPGPPLADVLRDATWVRVDAPAQEDGLPVVVDLPLLASEDGASGRRVLAIKKAAFGVHVVRADEIGALDPSEADSLDLQGPSHVLLVGTSRTCVAMAGTTLVRVVDDFGRELEPRHELQGCGGGPYAPLGVIAERIPIQLGWVGARCNDTSPGWDAAEDAIAKTVDGAVRVGTFVIAKTPVVRVFATEDAMHLAILQDGGGIVTRSVGHGTALAQAPACAAPAG